jgi:hypothetical protein
VNDVPEQTTSSLPSGRARRIMLVTAPWLAILAFAIGGAVFVLGARSDPPAASVSAPDDGEGGISRALATQGISTGGDASSGTPVPGALAAGFIGDDVHDHGKQPTFADYESLSAGQLLPLFPPGTVAAADLPLLKQQVEEVRRAAERFPTVDAAKAAGYSNTTSDVPFMGEHYLNFDLVRKGVFDPSQPQGLLFSKIGLGGEEQLVGVWFLLIPGVNGTRADVQPKSFAGDLALWHAHVGLCLVGFSGASEGETKQSCIEKGGTYTPDLRWMIHVWVAPGHDNPDGVFSYLNRDLFQQQQAAADAANPPTGEVR